MVLVAGPGTRRYMLWISRADAGVRLLDAGEAEAGGRNTEVSQ
jgi:hypothetical protein